MAIIDCGEWLCYPAWLHLHSASGIGIRVALSLGFVLLLSISTGKYWLFGSSEATIQKGLALLTPIVPVGIRPLLTCLFLPPYLTPDARDLIRKFLKRQVNQRLGAGPTDADSIKTHPYFKVSNLLMCRYQVQKNWQI